MEWTRCPECGRLAAVTARTVRERHGRLYEHPTVRCVRGHWLTHLAVEPLAAGQRVAS